MRSVHGGDQFSSGGGQTYDQTPSPTTTTRWALPRNKATPMRTIFGGSYRSHFEQTIHLNFNSKE